MLYLRRRIRKDHVLHSPPLIRNTANAEAKGVAERPTVNEVARNIMRGNARDLYLRLLLDRDAERD